MARLQYTYVWVSNSSDRSSPVGKVSCGYIGKEGSEHVVSVVCSQPIVGRYVTLERDASQSSAIQTNIMNIEELVVSGRSYPGQSPYTKIIHFEFLVLLHCIFNPLQSVSHILIELPISVNKL